MPGPTDALAYPGGVPLTTAVAAAVAVAKGSRGFLGYSQVTSRENDVRPDRRKTFQQPCVLMSPPFRCRCASAFISNFRSFYMVGARIQKWEHPCIRGSAVERPIRRLHVRLVLTPRRHVQYITGVLARLDPEGTRRRQLHVAEQAGSFQA